jgi:hypothetical protein
LEWTTALAERHGKNAISSWIALEPQLTLNLVSETTVNATAAAKSFAIEETSVKGAFSVNARAASGRRVEDLINRFRAPAGDHQIHELRKGYRITPTLASSRK